MKYLVITEDGLERKASVRQEIVMTTRGYAQPAVIVVGGKTVKGFVQTAEACRDEKGRYPFFMEENNG